MAAPPLVQLRNLFAFVDVDDVADYVGRRRRSGRDDHAAAHQGAGECVWSSVHFVPLAYGDVVVVALKEAPPAWSGTEGPYGSDVTLHFDGGRSPGRSRECHDTRIA